jgi:hypothetical protein
MKNYLVVFTLISFLVGCGNDEIKKPEDNKEQPVIDKSEVEIDVEKKIKDNLVDSESNKKTNKALLKINGAENLSLDEESVDENNNKKDEVVISKDEELSLENNKLKEGSTSKTKENLSEIKTTIENITNISENQQEEVLKNETSLKKIKEQVTKDTKLQELLDLQKEKLEDLKRKIESGELTKEEAGVLFIELKEQYIQDKNKILEIDDETTDLESIVQEIQTIELDESDNEKNNISE